MNTDDLSKLYKIRFANDDLSRKNEIWQVICSDYLQRFVRPTDTIVDVACGHGEFLNNIEGKRKIGIDFNPDTKNFLDPQIEFYQCQATNLSSVVNGIADVVFTSNFLEHLPDKKTLDRFLDEVLTALNPSGKFIILGPNLRYLHGQYWDFYDHHLALTHLSLCEALQLKGFNISLCLDRFLPYTTQGSLPTHPWLVKTYLKFRIAWKFLGKQFLIIANKPSS